MNENDYANFLVAQLQGDADSEKAPKMQAHTQATSRYCFRAITALSVQGACVKECRQPFKHMQRSNGSAVKLPKGVAKKRLFCAKMS